MKLNVFIHSCDSAASPSATGISICDKFNFSSGGGGGAVATMLVRW